jgi:trimeric autotransporter adhesin
VTPHVCDASETELEDPKDLRAEDRKFLISTNERKNMSTKTIYKRIALVAVAALGAGVLSVAPANAATIQAANVTLGVATNDAFGLCLTRDEAATKVSTTPRVFQVGGTQLITVATGITGTLSITGPAVWRSTVATNTLSATQKVLTIAAVGSSTMAFTGAGSVSVAVVDDQSVALFTYYFSVTAACSVNGFSAADSFVSTAISANLPDANTTWDTAKSNVDENTTSENGGALYIRIVANNAYGTALPAGAYSVTATNGALVNIGTVQNLGTSTSAGTISTAVNTTIANGVVVVRVDPATAGVAQSTTASVTYNGVAVATKNLTFLGEAAKINILSVKSGTVGTTGAANTGYFVYSLTDAAGNAVSGGVALAGATATPRTPTITSAKTATPLVPAAPAAPFAAIGATGNGVVGFDCTAVGGVGTSNLVIASASGVNGNTLTATVAAVCRGGINTYTVSTDKAAYKIGEIAVITITAVDSTGGVVSDATAMGAIDTVSVGGGTLTKAVAATDLFTDGKRTYNAQMTTEGTFNVVVSVSGTTTKSATTGYAVSTSVTGVSNADVLKAIVSLIASINKQIAALQKALLRR